MSVPAAPTALGGPQGNPGGINPTGGGAPFAGGGGGGAGGAGGCAPVSPYPGIAGIGGIGLANAITGSPVLYGGGGGGGKYGVTTGGGAGGPGGGGDGGNPATSPLAPMHGTVNLGGGGGGTGESPKTIAGGTGGSGVVYLRFPGCASVVVSPGTNTVTTLPAPAGGCKVAAFTVSGTNTVTV